jgi:hypothetical protein
MPDRFSVHLERAMVTEAVIAEVGPVPDIPAERVTAYEQLVADVRAKQAAADAAHTAFIVKQAQNDEQWRALWLKLRSWSAVAKVTAPNEARPGLSGIDTSMGFTTTHARRRAEQTRAALSAFPADYSAAGMTSAQLNTSITDMLTAEEDEQALLVAWRTAQAALRDADAALDKENKGLYRILVASFPEGSPQRSVIDGIPTTTHSAKSESTILPPTE